MGRVTRAARQPSAAALAGLVFAVILTVVLVLLQSVAPPSDAQAGLWIEDAASRSAVETSLQLVPFAGIAFLWFVAVVRSRLAQIEDRFFETAFLGSGLLFVAILFSAAAVLSSVLAQSDAGILQPGTAAQAWLLAETLLGQFGSRMAAVFALTATTAGLRAGNLPRPLALVGYLCGLLLLLTPPLPTWAQLLFPVWVLTLSVLVLIRRPRAQATFSGASGDTAETQARPAEAEGRT